MSEYDEFDGINEITGYDPEVEEGQDMLRKLGKGAQANAQQYQQTVMQNAILKKKNELMKKHNLTEADLFEIFQNRKDR